MLSALLALPAWTPGHDACPTVTTVGSADFSLAEWVRKSWFIQEQQVLDFQPVTSNYCVAATYNLEGKTVPFFKGKVATVYNYANNDQARGLAVAEVNGPLTNAKNMTLCARAVNTTDSSRLAVAPCLLPNILAGPYWILGIGKAADGSYDWAVVIGGQPDVKWEDGCTTKESGVNNAGLWLFSRKPVASPEAIGKMHALLKAKGIARSRLHKVEQEGCTYHGFNMK